MKLVHRLDRRDLLVTALCLLLVGAIVFGLARGQHDRRVGAAESALSNCEQIELVKTEIRRSVHQSLLRLPKIAYYRTHPIELQHAISDGQSSVARFARHDCYALPAVKLGELKRPKPRRS